VCLWWLYFGEAARTAGVALARAPRERRSQLAANAYSLAHFPLIAGVIYIALGIEQVLAHLSHDQPGTADTPLDWTSIGALYGGAALYLLSRVMFLRLAVGSTPPAQLVALGVALLLLPAARVIPALAAFGLLAALLVALAGYERFSGANKAPTADDVADV
jgi:low temperature requirement protein LtrA